VTDNYDKKAAQDQANSVTFKSVFWRNGTSSAGDELSEVSTFLS
jgi:hypothetical protein